MYFYNARWYDSYLNHFTQPDTIVPDPYNPQSFDRYAYALNNPIRYTDPSGHSVDCSVGERNCHAGKWIGSGLFFNGKTEDIKRVENVINANLEGFSVHIDGEGHISMRETGDVSSQTYQQAAMQYYLKRIINSDGRMEITVVAGSDDVLIDSWDTNTLDVQDVEVLGGPPGVSSASALIHSLEEQYQKQVNGITDFADAHNNYAIAAEEAVAGADRKEDIQIISGLNLSVTLVYEYPGGLLFYTNIDPIPFTVTKHGCDPIRKMCY